MRVSPAPGRCPRGDARGPWSSRPLTSAEARRAEEMGLAAQTGHHPVRQSVGGCRISSSPSMPRLRGGARSDYGPSHPSRPHRSRAMGLQGHRGIRPPAMGVPAAAGHRATRFRVVSLTTPSPSPAATATVEVKVGQELLQNHGDFAPSLPLVGGPVPGLRPATTNHPPRSRSWRAKHPGVPLRVLDCRMSTRN